jgi:hypothetical protein
MSGISASRHHADWLSLVEVSGPFVSLPVLLKAFPQGLEPRNPTQAKALRDAYEEWREDPAAPGRQRAWLLHVLTALLGYPAVLIAESQTLPAGLEANMAEVGETLRPDFALVSPAGSDTAGQAQLLITSYPAEQALDRPVSGRHWKANPATRMMELLHASGVALGLVTNGEHWMLVFGPRGETTGYASWFGTLWLDEPITLRAFHSLLGVRRFFGVAADSTLLGLLKESAQDQQEVTDQLGYQVREAVEVLIQSFDTLDKATGKTLLQGLPETVLYEAALTVMMRLVFLFCAEEKGLLQLGKPLYDDNYAISTLLEQLQEVADQNGEEILERRSDAWARLLATFRAVHAGVHHQDLLMPAYGGSLFDPDRYPFLEGRGMGSNWTATQAEPLGVNNRVALHLLTSLQKLRIKIPGGGPSETRRISFRALGVEQIGHVYEGLLDHTAVRATEPVVGVKGTRDKEAEIRLTTLEVKMADGQDELIDFLKEETGRSASALKRAIEQENTNDEHKLLIACGHDKQLLQRIRPFAGLVREDSFERPVVVLPGSVYVTAGTTRRSTGTHYTPPSLTEPIVQYTLEPLVYQGPTEGLPREHWHLRSPKEILDLKVCDMAMGSGAFLVQACRYLAERLTEAWENEENEHPNEILATPEGDFSEGAPNERLVPQDAAERLAIARRIIADRCLYGVDINPMAVEMGKLSLWLITLDSKRPFTFLDHAFKCGDSLLGLNSFKQLENFSLRPEGGKQIAFSTMNLWRHVEEAKKKREALEAMPSDTPEQIVAKVALYEEAEDAVAKLKAAADVLVGVELKGLKGKKYDESREVTADHMMAYWTQGLEALREYAEQELGGRKTLHWPLAFPEIMERGGFDAFVGNPPFVGGQKITGNFGADYRDLLLSSLANGMKGSADLCAYFFLRIGQMLRESSMAGLLATNTIAQGDTREVGLDQLAAAGIRFPRAIPSRPWPGIASLEIAHVWLRRGGWQGTYVLDDQPVASITPFLTVPGRVHGKPFKLEANSAKSFQGSNVLGMGFVLTLEEAQALIAKNSKNTNCLFPYLNGEDLNSRVDQSSGRWVINFRDWPLNRLGAGHWHTASGKEQKAWLYKGIVPKDYPDPVAADYPELLAIIEENVKPERDLLADGDATARDRARRWWQFARPTRKLYAAINGKHQVLVRCQTSRTQVGAFVANGMVYGHKLVVFIGQTFGFYGLLDSSIHYWWVLQRGSSLRTDPVYTPSDCFETFPFPESLAGIESIGERYHSHRQSIMQARNEGLTKTYNRFHDPSDTSVDILELRRLQLEMDNAVAEAYEWSNFDLNHGFHETKLGPRYTISEGARRELLDRLLALNHKRYGEEEDGKITLAAQSKSTTKRGRKQKNSDDNGVSDLFDLGEAKQV